MSASVSDILRQRPTSAGLAFWLHWHGWHAFRRGLATNLHELGTDDKEIQAILRHSDVRLTQNIYIKSVDESQVDAMDTLSQTYNDLAAKRIH